MSKREAQESMAASRRGKPFNAALSISAISVALALGMAPSASYAQASEAVKINIPAQSLNQALLQLGQQTDIQIYYLPEIVQGFSSPAVSGTLTPDQVLQKLLSGTGIEFRRSGKNISLSRSSEQTTELPAITVTGAPEAATGPVYGYVAKRSATGTKTDTPIIETPQSISVVTADQIKATGSESLGEALTYTAGVTTVASASNDAPSIRGFAANRTAGSFYLDGTKISMEGFSDKIEMYAYDRVEVLKGASSVLYGATDPGGVINLVSKRPSPDAVREINLSYGSHDRREASVDIGGALDDSGVWSYRLTGLARESNTFRDYVPDDRVFIAPALKWQPSADTSLTLLAQYQRSSGVATIALPPRGTLLDDPNGKISRDRFSGEPGDYYRPTTRSIGYLFEHAFNDQLKLRNTLRYYDITNEFLDSSAFSSRYVSPTNFRDLLRQQLHREDDANAITADTSLEYRFHTGPIEHVALAGVDYTRQKWVMNRNYYQIAPLDLYAPAYGAKPGNLVSSSGWVQHSRKTGFYFQDQMKLYDRWVLTAGGRQDWVTSDQAGQTLTGANLDSDDRDSAFTGRVGLVYLAPSGVAPFFSYSQSFQPTGGTDRLGNVFKPTTGDQYEAGVRYQPPSKDLMLSASVYQLTQSNVLTPDPIDTSFNVQLGQVRSRGLELEAHGRVTKNLSLLFAYSYTDATTTRSNDPTQIGQRSLAIPRNQVSLWVDYKLGGLGLPGLTVGGGVRYIGSSPANLLFDGSTQRVTVPAYTVGDLAVTYETGPWRYALNITNLTDKHYVLNGSGLVAWGEPRRAILTASYRW